MDNRQQMNQHYQQQQIDLVDIVEAIYRRRTEFIFTFCICIAVTFGFWFTWSQKVVTSVFVTGNITSVVFETHVSRPVMFPLDAKDLLYSIYIPESIAKHSTGKDIHFEAKNIEITAKPKSSIIVLVCTVGEELEQFVISVINDSLEALLAQQKIVYEKFIKSVKNGLETKVLQLEETRKTNPSDIHNISELETIVLTARNQLLASSPSEILKPAEAISKRPASLLICGLGGIVTGLFLGCIVVFFLELFSKVKVRVAESV